MESPTAPVVKDRSSVAVGLTKLDPWARELIVDPLSKEPLTEGAAGDCLMSAYGRQYPIVDGIFDLRVLNNETTRDQRLWKEGQRAYENAARAAQSLDPPVDPVELDAMRRIYNDIPVEGDCLDVGGHQGRLRAFLAPDQRYISCDPFREVFHGVEHCPHLLKTYPFLLEPVNFVCCDAEFLPFRSCCFQTVHMRSVVDHFLNPELAFHEAYRVLRSGGSLIVGLFVEGGRTGQIGAMRRAKELAKAALPLVGVKRFEDHHIWHPTYDQLTRLVSDCGFEISSVRWQEGYAGGVCYIKGTKRLGVAKQRS